MNHDIDYLHKLSIENQQFLYRVLTQIRDETADRRRRDCYYQVKFVWDSLETLDTYNTQSNQEDILIAALDRKL
jgi:hypothetical protein